MLHHFLASFLPDQVQLFQPLLDSFLISPPLNPLQSHHVCLDQRSNIQNSDMASPVPGRDYEQISLDVLATLLM